MAELHKQTNTNTHCGASHLPKINQTMQNKCLQKAKRNITYTETISYFAYTVCMQSYSSIVQVAG